MSLIATIRRRIKKWWLKYLFNVQRRARKRSHRAAIKQAQKITAETGKKVLIFFVGGEYKCVTKQQLRKARQQYLEKYAETKIESYATRKQTEARASQAKVGT